MNDYQGARHRRGAGNGSIIVLLAAGAMLLVAAYQLGSHFGTKTVQVPPPVSAAPPANFAEPAPPPAPGSSAERTPTDSRAPASPAAGRAPVQLEPAEVHLGVVRPGESPMAETRIRNTSDRPLRITQGRPSCACTKVELSERVILPRQAVTLRAAVDTTGILGRLTSGVYIHFDGFEQFVPFRIVVDVALPVRAEPSHIAATEAVAGQIALESLDGQPFRIVGYSGIQPRIAGVGPGVDEPQSRYMLEWDLGGYDPNTCRNASGEPMPTHLVIETDHPECRVLDVEIRHMCSRRDVPSEDQKWLVRNRRVYLGEIPAYEPTEFRADMVWVRRATPDEAIIAVVTDSDQFSVELVAFESDGTETECLVRVTPRPGHQGIIHGDLFFLSERGNSDRVIVIGAVAN
jgi:hypothetical protein